jgi:hypothetical protein
MSEAMDGPLGDASRHLAFDVLQQQVAVLTPPNDAGTLALIVARADDSEHHTPERVLLTPDGGVPGDAWGRSPSRRTDCQITMMRVDVGRLVANGQPLSLFGDNLLVDLDLSRENLATGSRLRVGEAILEVTAEPHNGCWKYRQRFGSDALRLTAEKQFRDLRLRGIYVKVVHAGHAAVGDAIEVLTRS